PPAVPMSNPALTRPTERPDPPYNGQTPLRTLLGLYRQAHARLALALLVYIVKHSPSWAMPLVTANIINIITRPEAHPITELWWNGAVLLGLQLQNIPTNALYVRLTSRVIRRMEVQLRARLARQFQQLSIGYFGTTSAGALQTKVLRDVEVLEQLTRQVFQDVPALLLTIVVVLTVTALRVPWFLVFFALIVPLALGLYAALQAPIRERNREFRGQLEHLSGRVSEMLRMIPVTRAHSAEQGELSRTLSRLNEVRDAGLRLDSVNGLFGSVTWVVFQGLNAVCLVMAGWAAYTGSLPITVGDVVLISGYFATLTGSALGLVNTLPLIAKGLESVRSIGEVLESPDLEHNEGKRAVTAVRGAFSLQNVNFSYGPEAGAPGERRYGDGVENLNLEVRSGETIALVGPSGAGKSTVINLLIGFLRPGSGQILLDGQDMAGLDLRTYRQHLSVVPQETLLFDGSVRDNILYGTEGLPDERLEQVLADAHIQEFLADLPEGLDTRLGEHGARLSGGQKQRIAIARALVRDPRVLILDEATSALDSASEHLIQNALTRLLHGRTCFVVAHRLSTVARADRIVVMKRGRIAEIGTHIELLERGGLYASLHALQRQG
ncbi:ABC transporter ATP-binding protein, partial [Deinococcus marmoris]|uniref:ABC transporter ATP-binding protein n=2 Tax=Deinococcus marmoris TaxID=249408 RepID=UPI0039EEAF03